MTKNKSILEKEILKANKDLLTNTKPLDKEEKEILNTYENQTILDMDVYTNKKDLKDLIKAQQEYKKSKQITIRIQSSVINNIKQKAKSYGLNYQTYINIFLNQLAQDKLQVILK